MKNIKTKKVSRITYNSRARNTYFKLIPEKGSIRYLNKKDVIFSYNEKSKIYQLKIYNQAIQEYVAVMNIKDKPEQLDSFGNYVVYNVERHGPDPKHPASTIFLGMDIRLLDLTIKKKQVIFRAGSGRYNPQIWGNDVYWIDHGYIKHYNIRTKKTVSEAYNGRSLNSQLPGSIALYYKPNSPSINLGYGRPFSVYGNRMVYETYRNGQWDIFLKIISTPFHGLPSANFNYSPLNPKNRQLVTFDGSLSRDTDGRIVSYKWNFGDGGTSSLPRTSHLYTTPGYKTVTLMVTDNSGFTQIIKKIIKIGIVPGKDLIITNINAPFIGKPGTSITVQNSIQNIGDTTATSFHTKFYLVPTKSLSGTTFLIGSRYISTLISGSINTHKTTLYIPANTPLGKYYIAAITDANSTIREYNENNNLSYSPTRTNDYMDLKINYANTYASSVLKGGKNVIDYEITNKGVTIASNISITFYLKNETSKYYLGKNTLTSLGPGKTIQSTFQMTTPSTIPNGQYSIEMIVTASPSDIDKTNNSYNIIVQVVDGGLDLAVSDLKYTIDKYPYSDKDGQVTLTYTLKNLGTIPSGPIEMFFYLDPPIADRVQLGKIGTSSIAANSTQVKTNTIKIPAGTSIYSVHFLVYADSSTSELSYLNNTAVVYNPI